VSAREARPRRRRRGPSPVWRVLLVALGVILVFVLGLSIGRALEDGPSPGGTETRVRTLQPEPLPPAPRTVTVTVTTG
jgi:hypothetical protein